MAEPDHKVLFESLPGLYLVLDPGLRIIAASEGFLKATSTRRDGIVERLLRDVFPQVQDVPSANTLRSTQATPILDRDGSVAYTVHRIDDLTDWMQPSQRGRAGASPAASGEAQPGDTALPGERTPQPVDPAAPHGTQGRHFPVPTDVEAPHVLIVEDDAAAGALVANALGRDYWISCARNGREAVQKALQADRPDLIIADASLPDMPAAALVAELRGHCELEDVPIVMLAAPAHDALRLRLLRQGVQDYLYKPFPVDELLARVQSLLARWKRARQRLRQSEERYRTLFNSVDEGFCIIEMVFDESDRAVDCVFLENNPSFSKHTGLADIQGKRLRDIALGLGLGWLEVCEQVALTGEPVRFERYSEPLGRWLDARAFRYGDRENRQVALLFNDITERKRSEEALREADRRKDRFLALLAHELRNPLAPIRNAVQILHMSPAANMKPISHLLPMMERQLAHMARLLDDLLDVSLIANGMVELRKVRIDVAQAVQAGVEASKPLIDSKGHRMRITFPPQPVVLEADPVRLAQVVSNLLNNAAHYSNPGGDIHLSVEREGSEIRLSVKDSGIGIRPEDLDSIFGLFVQAGPPFAHRQGGLGVGLSLVLTMVELHGGRVEARSAGLGQGSEFVVMLPAANEAAWTERVARGPAGGRA